MSRKYPTLIRLHPSQHVLRGSLVRATFGFALTLVPYSKERRQNRIFRNSKFTLGEHNFSFLIVTSSYLHRLGASCGGRQYR